MERKEAKQPRKRLVSRFGWLGLVLLSIGGKLKSLLPLLKFGKFGGTLITMFLSVGAYAIFYPFQFALGLVIMIFIHEMGHVWAAKIRGLPVSAPSFIPFLGALITMKRSPSDAETEAFIAYGGPLLGSLGALACYGLGIWLHDEVLLVVAFVGFMINLFNLLPIHPLDGGRIVVAITRWLWAIGLVAGLALIVYLRSVILIFVYILFVTELWGMFRGKNKKGKPVNFQLKARVEKSRFTDAGLWIPGEEHRRELPFRQYSDVATQTTYAAVDFPGIGTIAKFPFDGKLERVELVKTVDPDPGGSEIRMILHGYGLQNAAPGGIQTDDKYYQVSPRTRWLYGFAYVGLIAFLVYMILQFGSASLPDPRSVA